MSCRAWTAESDGLVWNFPTVHLSLVQMFKPPVSHQSYRHVQDDSFSELWGLNGIKHTCRTLNTGYIWQHCLFWRREHARSLELRDPKSLWYLLHYFKNIVTFIHYRRLEIIERIKHYCHILCALSLKKKKRQGTWQKNCMSRQKIPVQQSEIVKCKGKQHSICQSFLVVSPHTEG